MLAITPILVELTPLLNPDSFHQIRMSNMRMWSIIPPETVRINTVNKSLLIMFPPSRMRDASIVEIWDTRNMDALSDLGLRNLVLPVILVGEL
jgi:hypothetical protein